MVPRLNCHRMLSVWLPSRGQAILADTVLRGPVLPVPWLLRQTWTEATVPETAPGACLRADARDPTGKGSSGAVFVSVAARDCLPARAETHRFGGQPVRARPTIADLTDKTRDEITRVTDVICPGSADTRAPGMRPPRSLPADRSRSQFAGRQQGPDASPHVA